MTRKIKAFTDSRTTEVKKAREPKEAWKKCRLAVAKLIADRGHSAAQIAHRMGVSRQTVFNYRDMVRSGGIQALFTRRSSPGRRPIVEGKTRRTFQLWLKRGNHRTLGRATAWVHRHTKRKLTPSGMRKLLARLGARVGYRIDGYPIILAFPTTGPK